VRSRWCGDMSLADHRASLPLGADGRTLWDIGLRAADGMLLTLIPRGSTLPASGRQVVTTSRHNQPAIELQFLTGIRVQAAANLPIHEMRHTLATPLAERGLPQLLVEVSVNEEMKISTTEMGTTAAHDTYHQERVPATFSRREARANAVVADVQLPSRWRFNNPWSRAPHRGLAVRGRFLHLEQRPLHSGGGELQKGDDGEVKPGLTAAKVSE